MKTNYSLHLITLFCLLSIEVHAASVDISGPSLFCPGSSRTPKTYTINCSGFTSYMLWSVTLMNNNGKILDDDGVWKTSIGGWGTQPPASIQIDWDDNYHGDEGVHVSVQGKNWTFFITVTKTDAVGVQLLHSNPPLPTITPSTASLSCGSTSNITFDAYWPTYDQYDWEVLSGGSISGSSTGSTLTVIPSNGLDAIQVRVRSYNSSCQVWSSYAYRTIERNPPTVSSISGPDHVCFGAPSVENHYVNYIPGVTYAWSGSGLAFPNGDDGSQVTVQGTSTGDKTLSVTVTGCGDPVTKEKSVFVASGTPMYPVIYQMPYQHCAGYCENYSLMVPTGYASEMQYRYNYGSWYTANSSGIANICTSSYDYGYKPVELRSIGICGNYSSINTQSIQVTSCGYMMSTSAEDSLAISELTLENDVVLYPNPASSSMAISLPEDTGDTQLTIINDKNEVIATFKNNKKIFTLNTSKLHSGYYYIRIEGQNRITTKRFLVE